MSKLTLNIAAKLDDMPLAQSRKRSAGIPSIPGALPTFSLDRTSYTSFGEVRIVSKVWSFCGREETSGTVVAAPGRTVCSQKKELSRLAFSKGLRATAEVEGSVKSGMIVCLTLPWTTFMCCQKC